MFPNISSLQASNGLRKFGLCKIGLCKIGLCKIGLCKTFLRPLISALFLSLAFLLAILPAAAADVPRAYAGIVIDAKTGNTLYSYAADSTRYPASVTKVMTLYVLFQELEAGRMNLSTRMTVSRHATQAVPTKLHLRAGRTIKVEDAIKALVTVSANDVARVIAEHISGSESAFARRMTSTARALGMSRTTYANASGLPDRRQITTVRDQARLGMAVFQHFPRYYEYFQIRSFKYGGHTYGNHNRLLGERGVDGIKTGYTRASGYNLLTAARQNNRHVVVVGFGFSSGSARNAKVRELLARYMNKGRRGSYWRQASIPTVGAQGSQNRFAVAQNTPVTPAPRPAGRDPVAPVALIEPQITPPVLIASIPTDTQMDTQQAPETQPIQLVPLPATRSTQITPVSVATIAPPTQLIPTTAVQATTLNVQPQNTSAQPLDVIGAWLTDNFTLGSSRTGPLQNSGVATLVPPANLGQAPGQAIDLMTSGSVNAPTVSLNASSAVSVWVVQIGASDSENAAQGLLLDAKSRVAGLNDFRPYVERFEKTGQNLFQGAVHGVFRTRPCHFHVRTN